MRLIEHAAFQGGDSGLTYTFDISTQLPTPGSVTGTVDLLQSQLNSSTKSNMAGPEMGLRFDLGSNEKFLIWGQSKFALLANQTVRDLTGFGILRREAQPNLTIPPQNAPTFTDHASNTSVSPLFEQSVFVKSNVLSFVPVVKKMKLFEMAQFQLGYTWTVVGAVYRPNDDINWRGYPEFPSLYSNKGTWFMSSVSMGVEWHY